MADITITAANVVTVSGKVENLTSGATITAGQLVYKDSANSNVLKLVDNAAAASAVIAGVALHASLTGQPLQIQTSGTITIGGTVALGELYFASPTAGGVAPDADVLSNDYRSLFGFGTSTSVITIDINNTGVQVA